MPPWSRTSSTVTSDHEYFRSRQPTERPKSPGVFTTELARGAGIRGLTVTGQYRSSPPPSFRETVSVAVNVPST
jgi:hypothetical protein